MRFWTVIGKSLVSEVENHIPCAHKSEIGTMKKAGCDYSEGLENFVTSAQGNLEKAIIKSV